MSTVSAKTIHTIEFTASGRKTVAKPNEIVTLLKDEAERLAAVGAVQIIETRDAQEKKPVKYRRFRG